MCACVVSPDAVCLTWSIYVAGSGEAGRGTLSSRSSSSISRQKERRRSAGDEQGLMTQLNMFVRTRTDSGKQLTDMVSKRSLVSSYRREEMIIFLSVRNFNPLPPSDAVRKQMEIFLRIFSVQYCHSLKNYHPSGNLKFNNLSIFFNLELRILMEKILPISLKLSFTPNTLGCYGLSILNVEVDTWARVTAGSQTRVPVPALRLGGFQERCDPHS